jgi:hypothetical protein
MSSFLQTSIVFEIFDIFEKIYEFLGDNDQISLSQVQHFQKLTYDVERHHLNIHIKNLTNFLNCDSKNNRLMKQFVRDLMRLIDNLKNSQQLKEFQTPLFVMIDHKHVIKDVIHLLKNQGTKNIYSKIIANLLIGNTKCHQILDIIDPSYLKHLKNSSSLELLYIRLLCLCQFEDTNDSLVDDFYIDCYSLAHNRLKIDQIFDLIPKNFEWISISHLIIFLRKAIYQSLQKLRKLIDHLTQNELMLSNNVDILLHCCLRGERRSDSINPELAQSLKNMLCLNDKEFEFFANYHPLDRVTMISSLTSIISISNALKSVSFILLEPQENVNILVNKLCIDDIILNYDFVDSLLGMSYKSVQYFIDLLNKRNTTNWFDFN